MRDKKLQIKDFEKKAIKDKTHNDKSQHLDKPINIDIPIETSC